jgi:predicted alpha/beta hydrolase family esterase
VHAVARAGFVIPGALGHMNSASALGDWPVGAMLLEAFRAGMTRR